MYWLKRKWQQINRVIDFLPIIWKGYDWDYRYALELFQHQLKRTANEIERNGNHVGKENTAHRIRTAVELLEKVYDEEYATEYQDDMKFVYGDNVLDWRFEDTGHGNGSSYLRYEYERWENADEVQETFDKLFKRSQDKQKRAQKLVWEFINHNIQYWWD